MISKTFWLKFIKRTTIALAVTSPLILIVFGYVVIRHYSIAIPSITSWLLDYQIGEKLLGDFSITNTIIHSRVIQYILTLTEYKNTLRFLITLFLWILGVTWFFRWFDILFSGMEKLIKWFLWLIGTIPSFLWKAFMTLWGMLLWKNIHSALWVWLKRYYAFLRLYSKDENIRYILLTHIDSIWRVFIPRSIPRPTDWREYHEFKTPFDLRKIMMNFNRALNTIFWNEKHYITDLTYNDSGIHCSVNKGGDTYQELIEKISANKKEFTIHLPKMSTYDMGLLTEDIEGVSFDIKIRMTWKTQKLSLAELERRIVPWKILLWFQMGTIKNPFIDYYYKISDLTSWVVIAETRSGKDWIIIGWLAYMLLLKKKGEESPIIYIYDLKEADAKWAIGLGHIGVHRIGSDMGGILASLAYICDEIDRRYRTFWTTSKIESWNALYSEKRFDYITIFFNEAWLFLWNADVKDRKILLRYLNKILMTGAGAGVKVNFLNQTIRAQQFEGWGKMLASIPTRYIWKLANSTEYEIALWSNYSDRRMTIEKYNFLMIEDNSIKAEIRGYDISQSDLADFIDNDKFFERRDIWGLFANPQSEEVSIEEGVNESETKQKNYLDTIDIVSLLQEAFNEWQLPRALAMAHGVPEKKFPSLKRILEELEIVEIKTWLACLVNKNMTAEEAVERFNNRTK